MGFLTAIVISLSVISIPVLAMLLSYKKKTQINRIKELQLQKEIMEMEIVKQNGRIKLLEEENKNLDKIINPKT